MGRVWRDTVIRFPPIVQRDTFTLLPLQVGVWEYDALGDRGIWDGPTYQLHGLPVGSPVTFDVWASCVHARERDVAARVCREHLERDEYMSFSYRTETGRTIVLRGKIHRDASSRPVSVFGAILDLSAIQSGLTRAYAAAHEVGELLGVDDLDPDHSQLLVRRIRDTLGGLAIR